MDPTAFFNANDSSGMRGSISPNQAKWMYNYGSQLMQPTQIGNSPYAQYGPWNAAADAFRGLVGGYLQGKAGQSEKYTAQQEGLGANQSYWQNRQNSATPAQTAPPTQPQPVQPTADSGGASDAYGLTAHLETGRDPSTGLSNISADTGGSKSYGNLGLNSRSGSVTDFMRRYSQLGLTGTPGTPEFDASWRQVAAGNPQGLLAAERDYHSRTISGPAVQSLQGIGIPPEVASHPAVTAYFSDRAVQQGVGSIRAQQDRILGAYRQSGGDPTRFIQQHAATDLDPRNWQHDFRSAIQSRVYGQAGNTARVTGRLHGAMGIGQRQQAAPGAQPGLPDAATRVPSQSFNAQGQQTGGPGMQAPGMQAPGMQAPGGGAAMQGPMGGWRAIPHASGTYYTSDGTHFFDSSGRPVQ